MEYKIDATNKILGRLASEIALILRGKNTPDYNPAKIGSDSVIVFNTDKLRVTGKKLTQKSYYSHSGYPGGIREEKLMTLMKRDSRLSIRRAVMGMLPKNKLRAQMIKHLILIKGEQ